MVALPLRPKKNETKLRLKTKVSGPKGIVQKTRQTNERTVTIQGVKLIFIMFSLRFHKILRNLSSVFKAVISFHLSQMNGKIQLQKNIEAMSTTPH